MKEKVVFRRKMENNLEISYVFKKNITKKYSNDRVKQCLWFEKKYFFDKNLMRYCEKSKVTRFLKTLNEKMFLCKITIKSYKKF